MSSEMMMVMMMTCCYHVARLETQSIVETETQVYVKYCSRRDTEGANVCLAPRSNDIHTYRL